MANHTVTFPITDPNEILKLRAGDEVTVQGHIIGIRDRTQIRIFDQGVEPPMDLAGAFLLHTAPNVRKVSEDAEGRGTYEKICIGTTTSARMVRFTEPLGKQYGVRAICGKGGFPDEAIAPMHELGMVYFAIVGGAAGLETTQIEEIEEVAWEELMPECLWKFRRSEEHTSELQSLTNIVCRLLLEKKKKQSPRTEHTDARRRLESGVPGWPQEAASQREDHTREQGADATSTEAG